MIPKRFLSFVLRYNAQCTGIEGGAQLTRLLYLVTTTISTCNNNNNNNNNNSNNKLRIPWRSASMYHYCKTNLTNPLIFFYLNMNAFHLYSDSSLPTWRNNKRLIIDWTLLKNFEGYKDVFLVLGCKLDSQWFGTSST